MARSFRHSFRITLYYNNSLSGADFGGSAIVNYCCTAWLPFGSGNDGIGNFTNAPLFVDSGSGDFRLQSASPCINAGRNKLEVFYWSSWVTLVAIGPDLDGNSRITRGTVDIGAYEFQSLQSDISYAWLQQYGLPTDGSADFADLDSDGHNNWQEWQAWTDPTNSASALRLLAPNPGTNGILIQWQSVNGQTYFLERSTCFGEQPSFVPLNTNIVGQAGTTAFTDTHTAGAGPFFYRVGVKE